MIYVPSVRSGRGLVNNRRRLLRMAMRIPWVALMWGRMNWIEVCGSRRAILFVGCVCLSFVNVVGDGLWWLINVDAAWWNLCWWILMMVVCGVCDIVLVDCVRILGWWHFLD